MVKRPKCDSNSRFLHAFIVCQIFNWALGSQSLSVGSLMIHCKVLATTEKIKGPGLSPKGSTLSIHTLSPANLFVIDVDLPQQPGHFSMLVKHQSFPSEYLHFSLDISSFILPPIGAGKSRISLHLLGSPFGMTSNGLTWAPSC